MKTYLILASALAVGIIAGCAQMTETILSIKQKADDYTEEAVRQSVEGARAYCGAVPEERRLQYRAVTDIAGKGPVLEIHCERL